MALIQTTLPQPQAPAVPATELALAQLARAALGLVQAAGQPVPAVVAGALPGGLTQLQIGEMVLAVRLSAPLVAGTAVKLSIATDGKGQTNLQVTPAVAGGPPNSAQPAAPVALAQPPVAQSVVTARSMALPEPPAPPPTAGSPGPQANAPAAVPQSAAASAPAATTTPRTAAAMSPPSPQAAPPKAAVNIPDPAQSAAKPATPAVANTAGPTAPPSAVGHSPQGAGAVAPAPMAAVAAPAAAVVMDAGELTPAPNPAPPRGSVDALKAGAAPTLAAALSRRAPVAGGPLPAAPAQLATPQAVGQQAIAATVPGGPSAVPAMPAAAMSTTAAVEHSPALSRTLPAQGTASGAPVSVATPQPGGAMAIPYRATPPGAVSAPAASPPLAQVLADPAQAAARQNSIVPLLAKLAALGPQLNALPLPAAQAILRLLAMRLEVGGLDGKALQTAVATAGVLARPAAGAAPTTPTLKSALLQLRGSLAGVPGAEIEAVQAVAGRPHPPVKGDEARAVRAELPMPADGEEPARGLLGQTDAALSRLKLLQHASQPPESRPGAPAQQELRIEVPLMIGAETALVQMVVDREARRREQPGVRGWRMRFAFASRQTGEVGAEVALFGSSVSVALWADTPDMEAALTSGLDGLRGALLAEGLDAGSIRVRRRGAAPSQQPGALMDSAR